MVVFITQCHYVIKGKNSGPCLKHNMMRVAPFQMVKVINLTQKKFKFN